MTQWQWQRPDPFTMEIHVTESQVDRLGHANNVVYLQWMEAISWAHIESVGLDWPLQQSLGRAMAIVRTEVDYRAAAFAGDELVMGTWLTHFDGRLHSRRYFQLVRRSDGQTLIEAESRHVCIDIHTQRPARVPPPMAERLRQAENPSAHPTTGENHA